MGSGLLGPGPPVENYTEVIPLPGGDADVFTNAQYVARLSKNMTSYFN